MSNSSSLLLGRTDPPPAQEALRAGPLRLLYEPGSGFVRRLQLGEREVLRGIYAAVRDHNWDTVPGTFTETHREILEDAFHLEFAVQHRWRGIDFVWRGTVTGAADGLVRYSFEGEAHSTFRRNRIGLCVLHPIRECAGAPARQIRVDGSLVECRFPNTIERQIFGQNSFRDLQGLAHEVEPGVWAEVTFAGEVFEMEDQRNWTDASFKTYGTPLALPFPVEVRAGTRVRQSVTLRIEGWRESRSRLVAGGGTGSGVRVKVVPSAGTPVRLPRLGLCLASHREPLSPSQVRRLEALALSHLRVDLRMETTPWPQVWERAVREAAQLGVKLELALHLPRHGQADGSEMRRRLRDGQDALERVLALREGEPATTRQTLDRVRGVFEGSGIPIGAGSDANFCELNREQAQGRCIPAEADFVFWSMNPQVHAFDDLSVMETIEAQAATARTARGFADTKPLVVTPVTLRQRFNPVATGPEPPLPPDDLPRQVDPRQAGLFGAAWTLGSIAELASAGVDAITYYETTGWRGVIEVDRGSPLPAKFASVPGGPFPLYHVFAEIAPFAGGEILSVTSTEPQKVAALALRRDSRSVLLLANLGMESTTVTIEAFRELKWLRALTLDTVRGAVHEPEAYRGSVQTCMTGTLEMPALTVACLLNHP